MKEKIHPYVYAICIVPREYLTTNDIISAVFDFYKLEKSQVFELNRRPLISKARQLSIYLIHKLLRMPVTKIGKLYKRDHTTIIYTIDVITDRLSVEDSLRSELLQIENKIKVVGNGIGRKQSV